MSKHKKGELETARVGSYISENMEPLKGADDVNIYIYISRYVCFYRCRYRATTQRFGSPRLKLGRSVPCGGRQGSRMTNCMAEQCGSPSICARCTYSRAKTLRGLSLWVLCGHLGLDNMSQEPNSPPPGTKKWGISLYIYYLSACVHSTGCTYLHVVKILPFFLAQHPLLQSHVGRL